MKQQFLNDQLVLFAIMTGERSFHGKLCSLIIKTVQYKTASILADKQVAQGTGSTMVRVQIIVIIIFGMPVYDGVVPLGANSLQSGQF